MTQCNKCLGTGIVGNGPSPWLHEGVKSTCPDCKGTGLIPETGSDTASGNEGSVNNSVDSGDNSQTAGKGIIGRTLEKLGL